jgi:nitrate reductase molybdenum cofactor assembly chaperone NarJ/NarW
MIQTAKHPFELLAQYLDYPREGQTEQLRAALPELESCSGAAATKLGVFLEQAEAIAVTDREELFTRTFDINPACTLELGWVLYGQDYARGAFLVKMRQMLNAHEIKESGELPDHLTHVLQLLSRLPESIALPFVAEEVMPGLAKMREGFKDEENPYAGVLEAIWIVLTEKYESQAGPTTETAP